MRHLRGAGVLLAISLLSGCVNLLPPSNEAITRIDEDNGYRITGAQRKPLGEHSVMLAFSGGGTRAAALSYGVLQELRDTRIDSQGQSVRLLDEVDLISSVSGGSFTAAYYGLYGDDIFRYYERDFLRQSIQSALLDKLLSPSYWFHAMFSGINRTDMAVEYYDQQIFRGATFADIPLERRPFIEINATDLSSGAHISFTQGYFDLLCTNLYSYPVARAVTASSGVPMAFPPVTLKNHAGECKTENTYLEPLLAHRQYDNTREEELVALLRSYRDADKRPYVHLVDGGVSDNLGLRAIMDRTELRNMDSKIGQRMREAKLRNVLIILVNAEVKPAKSIDRTYQSPTMLQTAGALTDALIARYTVETRALLRSQLQQYETQAHAEGYDVHFYFAEVDFSALDSPSLQEYFNRLPTTLELDDEEIDSLITAGRELLRQSAPYRDFLARNGGVYAPVAAEPPRCTVFHPGQCWR